MNFQSKAVHSFLLLTIIIWIIAFCSCSSNQSSNMQINESLQAPIAQKKDTVFYNHGVKRVDPYFWMRLSDEQKLSESPDTQTQMVIKYLEAENSYTEAIMTPTESLQEELFEEMVARIKKDDETVPYFDNGYYYYKRYEKGSEYPIYCRKLHLNGEEEIILNCNERALGKEYYHAAGLEISPNNRYLAFAEDTISRRVYTYRFIDLKTGEFLRDKIENCEPGGAWTDDNQHFFYTAKNKISLLSEKIYRHKLGSSADVLVYHEKDPAYYNGVLRSQSGKYIIIYNCSTLSSDYHILRSDDPYGNFKAFTAREKVHEYQIFHLDEHFYILSNWDAENFRLFRTHENHTNKENWEELIAHRPDVLLTDLDLFRDFLVLNERSQGQTRLRVKSINDKIDYYVPFEEEAYVTYASDNYEFDRDKLRLVYSSLTTPTSVYDFDMKSKTFELLKEQEVLGGHDKNQYETKRMFADARDGAKIPMTIVYRKGTKLNASTPLLQYAYGSYGHTIDPWFSSIRLSLLDRGFVYAIAHIRGGQMMGRRWYEEGKLMNKLNTFYDFIDCSKHLISNQYTSEEQLFASGGSAGGLLMGAIANQAPQLYKGIISAVPFVDVINTMLDETIPLTTNEFDEWGNPKEDEAFHYMMKYSPYDNVTAQEYPNMLITTGYFDSQVQYWEPAKWVARLRDVKTDENLLLFKTNMSAGHGGASGRFERYRETALEYAFMLMLSGKSDGLNAHD